MKMTSRMSRSTRISASTRPIKIERKLVNKFTDYTGTFTKNVRVTYEFSFTLENTKENRTNDFGARPAAGIAERKNCCRTS